MMINEESFNLYMMVKSTNKHYKQIENYVFNNSDKFDFIILKRFQKIISVKSQQAKRKHCKILATEMESLFMQKGINMVQFYIITQCDVKYVNIITNLNALQRNIILMNVRQLLKLHNAFYIDYAKEVVCGKKMSNKVRYRYFNKMMNLITTDEIHFFRKYKDFSLFERYGDCTTFFIQNINDLIDFKLMKDKK